VVKKEEEKEGLTKGLASRQFSIIEFLPRVFVSVPIYQNLIVHITCKLHCFTTTKQEPLPYPDVQKSCYKLGR
jgi:hypothetical protein